MAVVDNNPNVRQALNALKLFTTSPSLRTWLVANDPMALRQVERAIGALTTEPHAFVAADVSTDGCAICGNARGTTVHV